MKYQSYNQDDFVQDEYFQRWVLNNDSMSNKFWENWIKENPDKKEIVEKAALLIKLMAVEHDELSGEVFDSMWQNIVQKRKDFGAQTYLPQSQLKNKVIHFLFKVAAVLVGFSAILVGVYKSGVFNKVDVVLPDSVVTLELQDGSIKVLDENSVEMITDSKGLNVIKHNKTTLTYQDENDNDNQKITFNKLTVPYGKKFQLILSDGSHVHLNSGTKLRYPTKFLKDKPRNVFLDGEAHFLVESDKARPFTVITDEMNTQVYGTEFNVSSYKNEDNTSTVLIEGSVGVYKANNENGQKAVEIYPGQRAVFKEDSISVDNVNVNKYTAWIDGGLYFVEDRFELMVKELERHFDVEINNQYMELNKKQFTGTFTNESLDKILRVFSEHTPFDYTVKGRVVTLTAKAAPVNN